MFGFLLLGCILLVGAVLAYLWKHKDGKIARGVGNAGEQYNEFYGLRQPPNPDPTPVAESDPYADLRAANVRRNRARHTPKS